MTEKEWLEQFNAKERRFEMFTKTGDKKCKSLVSKVCRKIFGKKRLNKDDILNMMNEGMKKISEKHQEVYDSEPPGHMCSYINQALRKAEYSFEINRHEFKY